LSPVAKRSPSWLNSTQEMISAEKIIKIFGSDYGNRYYLHSLEQYSVF
jgi:hypothetical protein